MNPVQLFHNLVNLAAIDQKFTNEEIDFLISVANRYNIPSEEFETALTGIREGVIEFDLPNDEDDRRRLMKEMIRMMAVDGELNEMEKRMCAQCSARMDFTSPQFSQILDEVLNEPQL